MNLKPVAFVVLDRALAFDADEDHERVERREIERLLLVQLAERRGEVGARNKLRKFVGGSRIVRAVVG